MEPHKESKNKITLDIQKVLRNEYVFGFLVVAILIFAYYAVLARLLLSRQYTFAGDTYFYWSFQYLILYTVKYFNSLPWWDPTNFGGYPLYYHFVNGWSNMLSPYYLPSLVLFRVLNVFIDVNINDYIVFHRTIYIVSLNIIAIYLISRELIANRIAAALPPLIFTLSYFQLLNFHDFYAMEAMTAPLFYLFALIRFNNNRTKGNFIIFLIFLSFLFASMDNGILMSAVFWGGIFTVLLLLFHPSLVRDAFRIFLDLGKTSRGRVIAVMLLLLVLFSGIAAISPFYYNAGHVLTYRGARQGPGGADLPVAYDSSGTLTDFPVSIVTSEIWTVLFNWIPFPDIHDNLLRFACCGHENRYIGMVTLPLILAALILCLKNRYTYILFLTYFLCNAFIIYATDNIIYKIFTDNSDILRNITNMSTIFPRGGPLLFLIFLAGIGLDRLTGVANERESGNQQDVPFETFFKKAFLFLIITGVILLIGGVMSSLSAIFYPVRHSFMHIGIYLLIFSFITRMLLTANNKIIRRSLLFCLLLLTVIDLSVSASSNLFARHHYEPGNMYDYLARHILGPYDEMASMGMTIPDDTKFRPINNDSEKLFPENYKSVYHNTHQIHWGIKEWLVLATREDGKKFLPNWYPQLVWNRYPSLQMRNFPDFRIFRNGYYLPFEKIRELDTDKSIYFSEPLFYLHDERLVRSKNADPREPVSGGYAIKEYTPIKVVLDTRTDKDGFLYFLDNYERFWSAYVDGKEVKIHRANFTFKAIELPAGTHIVSWVYNPYPVKTAYAIFYLTLIGFVVYFFAFSRNKA